MKNVRYLFVYTCCILLSCQGNNTGVDLSRELEFNANKLMDEYDFIDSVKVFDTSRVKLYLNFDFNDPRWEQLFVIAVRSELFVDPTAQLTDITFQLSYPKISPMSNYYMAPARSTLVKGVKLEYYQFISKTFTPSDHFLFSYFFESYYEKEKEEKYNVSFADVLIGLYDPNDLLEKQEYNWIKYLDFLSEIVVNRIEYEAKLQSLRQWLIRYKSSFEDIQPNSTPATEGL